MAGNVGRALTELDGEVEPERGRSSASSRASSSRTSTTFRPRVAVLLNLEPDHLDRHGTLEAYRDAKLRIFENQQRGRHGGRAARLRRDPRRRRGGSSSADDPLPAEPRIPGATTARTPRPRRLPRASSAWTVVGAFGGLGCSAIKLSPWKPTGPKVWLTDRADGWDALIFAKTDRVFRSAADCVKLAEWCVDSRRNHPCGRYRCLGDAGLTQL